MKKIDCWKDKKLSFYSLSSLFFADITKKLFQSKNFLKTLFAPKS